MLILIYVDSLPEVTIIFIYFLVLHNFIHLHYAPMSLIVYISSIFCINHPLHPQIIDWQPMISIKYFYYEKIEEKCLAQQNTADIYFWQPERTKIQILFCWHISQNIYSEDFGSSFLNELIKSENICKISNLAK